MTAPTHTARERLRLEVEEHEPRNDAERVSQAEIVGLLQQERAFDRTFFTPGHITGSAFIVDEQGEHVLLHHHRRLGIWVEMGGHDEGELDVRATALREAREESGLADVRFAQSGILDLDVHLIPAGRGEPPHRHFDIRFLCATSTPSAISADPAESIDLRWFSLAEAAEAMPDAGSRRALARIAELGRGCEERPAPRTL